VVHEANHEVEQEVVHEAEQEEREAAKTELTT
jgi:hypothetical protein